MDGEALGDPNNPSSRGQVATLSVADAGELDGIILQSYDGSKIALSTSDVLTAEITTRDINRGEHKHFLSKEIAEAPQSFSKTLRGRIVEKNGLLVAELGESVLPKSVRDRLASGSITKVRVIGQGTAAIAGQALARLLKKLVDIHLNIEEKMDFGLKKGFVDGVRSKSESNQ
jgi:glucosamine--fructose-6-phosphate aminotransferase (isomerizing)